MEDAEDDWLLDSLEKYEGIYMFELPQSTNFLDWDSSDGTAVWVVCRCEERNEVLLLALPERLLPPETQSLWAKRDFKMLCGGLSQSWSTCIKKVPSSESVVIATSESQLQVWTRSKISSDLLEETDTLHLWPSSPHTVCGDIFLDTSPSSPQLVLVGSAHNTSSVHILDLQSKSNIFSLEGMDGHACPLHCCTFLPGAAPSSGPHFVTCGGSGGQTDLWDWRLKPGQPPTRFPPLSCHKATTYSFAVRGGGASPQAAPQIARLAADGRVDLFDIRSPSAAVGVANVASNSSKGQLAVSTRFSEKCDDPLPCIKYSPSAPHLISTSGVHPGVKVHDTSSWSQDLTDATPIFVHDGHEVECGEAKVLTHTWQPSRQAPGKQQCGGVSGTLLSTDSLGSLHAWQWKIK